MWIIGNYVKKEILRKNYSVFVNVTLKSRLGFIVLNDQSSLLTNKYEFIE